MDTEANAVDRALHESEHSLDLGGSLANYLQTATLQAVH